MHKSCSQQKSTCISKGLKPSWPKVSNDLCWIYLSSGIHIKEIHKTDIDYLKKLHRAVTDCAVTIMAHRIDGFISFMPGFTAVLLDQLHLWGKCPSCCKCFIDYTQIHWIHPILLLVFCLKCYNLTVFFVVVYPTFRDLLTGCLDYYINHWK